MPRREDHEVRQGHVGHWIKKKTNEIHKSQTMLKRLMEQLSTMLHLLTTVVSKINSLLLKIILWNANGLAQHTEEVKNYIQNQQVDIMLISETHLTTRSYFKIPNYAIMTRNTPMALEVLQYSSKMALNVIFMGTTN